MPAVNPSQTHMARAFSLYNRRVSWLNLGMTAALLRKLHDRSQAAREPRAAPYRATYAVEPRRMIWYRRRAQLSARMVFSRAFPWVKWRNYPMLTRLGR